jgi:hypothetical protein
VTWRGKSAFTKLCERRGIHQVVASPRHPRCPGRPCRPMAPARKALRRRSLSLLGASGPGLLPCMSLRSPGANRCLDTDLARGRGLGRVS